MISGHRLNNFDVEVFSLDPVTNPSEPATLCFHYPGDASDSEIITRDCLNGPLNGRYVRVTNGPRDEWLIICEFLVY